MPPPPVSTELLQQALDIVEQYGSAYKALLVDPSLPDESTVRSRVRMAKLRGMKPSFRKEEPRISRRSRIGRMHVVIPDVQAKPGVQLEHLAWVGNFIAEKRPDVIVQIGDFADMRSLNKYERGTMRGENQRLRKDLQVAATAMDMLCAPFASLPDYKPEMHLTMGNHEQRLTRFADEQPYLDEIVGTHMLQYEKWGWTVHPYLRPVEIDGIRYCHYFVSGSRGMAVSSAPALLRLQKRTAVMGHNQKCDVAFHPVTHQWSMFVGCCYLHDEDYLGPQGNDVRRQIVVLHEVEDGKCDPMFVSLRFLEKAYS